MAVALDFSLDQSILKATIPTVSVDIKSQRGLVATIKTDPLIVDPNSSK